MSTTKNTRVAMLLGFLILLVSSGGGGETPEALAFHDGAGASAAEDLVRRPRGNPCAASDHSILFDSNVALTGADANLSLIHI